MLTAGYARGDDQPYAILHVMHTYVYILFVSSVVSRSCDNIVTY
jgi:hypothetical protein